ncbi:hypothetical protein B0T17DRAFT_611430 [Bombardia bombarda]|uniref:Uncharacterized protein n=1 Tax=Bombardia bombarda TaxID=252184 RepID=A0AA39XI26_9PEZI|nr:hypothetical protein B0T17DRAFT_611430 [Bombardia bombarda]
MAPEEPHEELDIVDPDIEPGRWPQPCAWTDSTDELLKKDFQVDSYASGSSGNYETASSASMSYQLDVTRLNPVQVRLVVREDHAIIPSNVSPPQEKPTRKPNYKPMPLQWPYELFLFLLISGLFTFIEYEIHILPQLNFHGLQVLPPYKDKPAGIHARPPLGPIADPDPRPPSTDYPQANPTPTMWHSSPIY